MTEWQRITWIFFHTVSLNYNENYKHEYINFFDSLKVIIPCSICRNHYNDNLNKDHLKIENNINSDRIFKWTVDLHNEVNRMHRKKIWTYEESESYYKKNNFNDKILKFFLLEYIKKNFRKGPEKTENLFKMMRSLPYIYPYEDKRNKLIDFKERFDLNRDSIKNWLLAFLIILKN
jgi:hypothetical protein